MAPRDNQKHAVEHGSKDEEAAARQVMDRMAEADEVPSDPRDWPGGKAKFLTFGSGDDEAYGEGATAMIGPAEVMHHAGGSVSVSGELVDNPEDFKGPPIPGGPTDPNAPEMSGERRRRDKSEDAGDDDN
jgi:hypothetical protein